MYELDPFTRLISGLVSSVLYDVPVRCRESEFNVFPAPTGQTCGDYAGAFATAVGGYIDNPGSQGDCNFCQYSVGQSFYASIGIDFSTRWRDLGIFVCSSVFNVLVPLLAAR